MVTSNELLNRWLGTSSADLPLADDPVAEAELTAAGVPWYVAPFGRDSLVTSYQSLPLNPLLADGTLRVLAALQARADDPWRDAEPGKILHDLRRGELAGSARSRTGSLTWSFATSVWVKPVCVSPVTARTALRAFPSSSATATWTSSCAAEAANQ